MRVGVQPRAGMQEAMPVRFSKIRRSAIAIAAVSGLALGVAAPASADSGHGRIKFKIKQTTW
jgi:hypothetical protein